MSRRLTKHGLRQNWILTLSLLALLHLYGTALLVHPKSASGKYSRARVLWSTEYLYSRVGVPSKIPTAPQMTAAALQKPPRTPQSWNESHHSSWCHHCNDDVISHLSVCHQVAWQFSRSFLQQIAPVVLTVLYQFLCTCLSTQVTGFAKANCLCHLYRTYG